jgi:serine protease AprX
MRRRALYSRVVAKLGLAIVAVFVVLAAPGPDVGVAAPAAVDASVLADTARGATAHFIVVLRSQGGAQAAAARTPGRLAAGRAIVRELRGTAASSQRRVAAVLNRLGVHYRAYWIVNAFAVEAGRSAVETLARLPEVASIEPDRDLPAAQAERGGVASEAVAGIEWNIARVNAPSLWDIGVTGQGIVYANADGGVIWDHPALKPHYRGWDGNSAAHDYNWWDAIHADLDGDGVNSCGFNLAAPCDDASSSHGTHAMGIAVGDDSAGNQVGVAPGAKWIACRNMDNGTGRPSSYIECLQFFLAPTDLQGKNPRPDRRPDVVGNSYACPPEELCGEGALKAAVDNMRAAGIFMAVAAGNEGPSCSSIIWPPAHYDSSITVGSVDSNDVIASSSSRGPITLDGSGRRKPDVVAPGRLIRSAIRNGFGVLSGTSMAAPHVGGVVALLWSAFPNLRGNVDATEQLLEQSAVPITSTQACGGDSPTAVPNNVYGYGRIDAYAAYQRAEAASPPGLSASDVSVAEGRTGATAQVTFVIALARPSTRTVTVTYTTVDGTATQGADYQTAAGTLSFAKGERSKTVTVQVIGDDAVEPDETFTFRLSAPSNASLVREQATATIVNDDVTQTPPPTPPKDETPPSISRLKLAGRTLSFTLSEAAVTTAVVKRGTRVITRITKSFEAGTRSLRLPTLKPARYVVTITARDAAGNTGRSTLAFRVKKR